jgi:ABC-type sugar transport system permease subunit
MATSSQVASSPSARSGAPQLTPPIMAVGVAQILLGVALLFGAVQVWNLPEFFNLGNIVQQFLGGVVGLVAIASIVSGILIFQLNNNGRLIGMLIDLFLAAFAVLYLGHLLDLYIGLDVLAGGIWRNAIWLLGFPIGYAIVWFAQRIDNDAIQKVGLGIMMLALAVILWNSGLLTSIGDLLRALFQPLTLATLGIIAVLVVMAGTLMREGLRFGETMGERESWQGWLFLLPNFVTFLLFFALPLLLSFYFSFTDYNAISRPNFVGLQNYTNLLSLEFQTVPAGASTVEGFSPGYVRVASIPLGANDFSIGARDPLFWVSLGNTFRYCIMLIILAIIPSLLLAMLLNSKIPGMKFYRAIFFLPSIAAVVGVALIWKWLYDPVIGFINYAIRFFAPAAEINWLTDDSLMLIATVIMAAWQVIGFNAVIFLAGLQAVPRELIEASTVDGAGPVRRFLSITLPLIAPTTFFVTVTTLISGLQAFSEMFILLGTTPSNARLTTVYYLYEEAFARQGFGSASATAWVLFVIIFIVTLIQFRLSSRAAAYQD